eukprot:gnl/TRDRNA2_/TRDRNA2_51163_c0_seq1.p1 gnl/TRDRNA2_/TRDRNA2_51163_c0~~gnl/TRDRNA2_/TRDRNA2_51163_c0_seq1.p1  ORF type:complete len:114 (-),score=11.16 gnl/TRDRNA2_/TRDRNA2_51163_c0_seq1:300-641(-)
MQVSRSGHLVSLAAGAVLATLLVLLVRRQRKCDGNADGHDPAHLHSLRQTAAELRCKLRRLEAEAESANENGRYIQDSLDALTASVEDAEAALRTAEASLDGNRGGIWFWCWT